MEIGFLKANFCCVCVLAFISTVANARGATASNIAVLSAAMKKNVPVTVVLPDFCETNDMQLPVLYLLHGYSDNNETWAQRAPIRELAEHYKIIVACPDGGFSSWYFDTPVDPSIRYETFISKELVYFMDHHYRTLARRESRAIAGQSMGGHGAMYLGIRHADTFSVVACLSGGVDLRPFPDKWDISKRLGDAKRYPDHWSANSVLTLAENLSPGQLALSIDCGTEDFFITANRNLHQILLQRKVPHDYTERPGGHEWPYWTNAIRYQMLFISDHLKR